MTPEQQKKLDDELVEFASKGDYDRVKAAVSLGADPAHDRSLAFRRAAREGRTDVAEYLLDNGADLHAMTDEALRYAVSNGRGMTASLLLKRGADANALEGEPLIKAAARGDEGMVRDLLAHKADPHVGDDQPLRKAAFNGHAGAVRLLLKGGADPFIMRGSAVALMGEKYEGVVNALAEEMRFQQDALKFEISLQQKTQDFLRKPYSTSGESAFIRAVKMNLLATVVEKMKQSGDTLSMEDMLDIKDRAGHSLAQLAAEAGQLKKLLDPQLWQGDVDGVQGAWNALPEQARSKSGVSNDDFQAIVAQHRQNTLKAGASRFKLKGFGA